MRIADFIKERKAGLAVIVMSLVLLYLLLSLMNFVKNEGASQCSCPLGSCPMGSPFLGETYAGIAVAVLLFLVGAFLTLAPQKPAVLADPKKGWQKALATLKDDEKKIYETIMASDGVMFQSELIEKTGFPKAKVSRALDRLEAGGYLERKRRGLSNVVVLKPR